MIATERFVGSVLVTYVLGLIICLPVEYALLPDIGGVLSPFLEEMMTMSMHVLGLEHAQKELAIYSDSLGMRWLFLFTGVFALLTTTLIFWFKLKGILRLMAPAERLIALYLALQLGRYGVSKVCGMQFPEMESNVLHSRLGSISPALLYWSTMSIGKGYTMFLGIVECVVAALLLHRRSRLIASAAAIAIMGHVVVVDISYGIDVVLFALLLLVSSLVVFRGECARRLRKQKDGHVLLRYRASPISISAAVTRAVLISMLVIECLWPTLEGTQYDALGSFPFSSTAYEIMDHPDLRFVFLHSEGFLIFHAHDGNSSSAAVSHQSDNSALLSLHDGRQWHYTLSHKKEMTSLWDSEGDTLHLKTAEPMVVHVR